jgi:predicted dehydrogenase
MSKLKVGIVGCGLIAKLRHIPAYKKMKNVEIRAVCDLNEEIAKSTAEKFKIDQFYTDTSEMFSKEELDIVDICVPPQIHAPIAIEAMGAGSNVIMEKPMALSVKDCDNMIDVAKRNNVKISVIHNKNFHKPFLRAKEMVQKGDIGDFVGMRIFLATPRWDMIDLKDHWYHRLPGGVIGETGPHIAYMSSEFIKNINEVDVYAKNYLDHSWAPHDDFRIELIGNNSISSVNLSYTPNYWVCDVDIIGTDAMLRLDLNGMILTKHNLKELKYVSFFKYYLSNIGQVAVEMIKNVFGSKKIGTDLVIEEFVECIMNNSEPPVTAEEGKEAVKIMEMVVEKYNDKYGSE